MTPSDKPGLLARLARLHTALVCDVLDHLGHRDGVFVGPAVRAMYPTGTLVGTAFTLAGEPTDHMPREPYAVLLDSYQQMSEGDVVVIGTQGERTSGIWGELVSIAARARGATGAVTDGLVRDVAQTEALDFPVFASGGSPLDSCGRLEITAHSVPITCGQARVDLGDLVIADAMGVAVIPAHLAITVLDQAELKLASESTVRAELARGDLPASVFARHGVL